MITHTTHTHTHQISDSANYSCEICSYAGSSVAEVEIIVEDPLAASGVITTPLTVSTPTSPVQTLAEVSVCVCACVCVCVCVCVHMSVAASDCPAV